MHTYASVDLYVYAYAYAYYDNTKYRTKSATPHTIHQDAAAMLGDQ